VRTRIGGVVIGLIALFTLGLLTSPVVATVKLTSPQYFQMYVRRQKNDANNAAGICAAVSRPHMRCVPIKSVELQAIQALHRIRERQIKARTTLVN
jgi:transposase